MRGYREIRHHSTLVCSVAVVLIAVAGVLGPHSRFAAAAEPRQQSDNSPAKHREPLSPQQAVQAMRIAPGLRVELVAAEPDLESPVAMAFGEDGRIWVVEMRDYPNGPAPGKSPEGRIKILHDPDGDGHYQVQSIFADELLFANGILPWRDGVIVTAAPHVLLLRDTDQDGRADQRTVLFEGFTALNPQLRVSHPTLSMDNWVVMANGLRGGAVRRAGEAHANEPPIPLNGMDFRFDPLTGQGEAITGMGQFGNTFDDWGNRFVCDNRHHLRHVVLPNRYLARNPNLAVADALFDTSELELGEGGGGSKVYPLSKNWTTSNLHAGRFTAACGVFIYRGTLLPGALQGAGLTCDPTGNLVHAESLQPMGGTFRSRPLYDQREFLASTDDWFRPVFLTHGPEGALYVVDMDRAVIEHPDFMPTELKQRPDLTWGKSTGRIWRIVPENGMPPRTRPNLGQASTEQLVKTLEHPEVWWRSTAQRLLLQRGDSAAVKPLTTLIEQSRLPQARVLAAWLLNSRKALEAPVIARMLTDESPRVREQALILAEPLLAGSEPIQKETLALSHDPDARVRFQAAFSLGAWDSDKIIEPLARIASANLADPWTRVAVASSAPTRGAAVLDQVWKSNGSTKLDANGESNLLGLSRELSALVGARQDVGEVARLLETASTSRPSGLSPVRADLALLGGLAEGLARKGKSLAAFLDKLPPSSRNAVAHARTRLDEVVDWAASMQRPLGERLEALRLIAQAGSTNQSTEQRVFTSISKLITQAPEPEVRLAAVKALSSLSTPEAVTALLSAWKSAGPAVRRELTEALLRRPDRTDALLAALEDRTIAPSEIDAASARRLQTHNNAVIRSRATKLFQPTASRQNVIARYQQSLRQTGDAQRGREVFRGQCATCHSVAGVGVRVGPDISDTRTKTTEMLMNDVLNPNAAIDANYVSYTVATRDGRVLSGLIDSETATSLTLRRAENQTEVLLKQEIEELRSSGQSLMPEALEQTITIDQMADLLAFLKNWRYLDGAIPVGDKDR